MTDDVLTLDGLRRRRTQILGVAKERRAHRVAVFGSVARGDARPDSDLDLLVDFEPGASLIDHVGLFQDLCQRQLKTDQLSARRVLVNVATRTVFWRLAAR